MSPENKISRLSGVLMVITLLLIIVVPILHASYWLTNGFDFVSEKYFFLWHLSVFSDLVLKDLGQMPLNMKFYAFLVSLLPLCVFELTIYFFIRLLGLFKRLIIFSKANVLYIKYIGITILIGQLVVHPVYSALISFVTTYLNPPGQRFINITFETDQFAFIGLGLIILLIAWVMEEGYKIYEEQKHII